MGQVPPQGSAVAWAPGVRLGEYALEARLGRGGMGEVWRARHLPTSAVRALKLTRFHDVEALERALREAEALARVDAHPHVVRVLAAGVQGDTFWLAMDLVSGGSLAQRLAREGPLPVEEAVSLVRAVARGLAHAHARGVLHRDIKPENVLFDEHGAPLLADFGLARLGGAHSLTATGEVLGTPAYMAPEQARGERVDAQADVWGLGALLYAALTGRPPFSGRSPLEILERLLAGRVVPPRTLRAGIPPALEAVCLRALSPEPQRRFPGALAMEQALAGAARARRRHVPQVAVALVACAGLALAVARWPASEAPPAPPPPPRREPVAGAGSPVVPPPSAPRSEWGRRVADELATTEPRGDKLDRGPYRAQVPTAERLFAQGLPIPDDLRQALARGCELRDPPCQHALGSILVADEATRERGLLLLWRASRPPEAEHGAGLELAAWLAPAEPEVAALLLAEAEGRRPPRDWTLETRVSAAAAEAFLDAPGSLGRALDRLRPHRPSAELRDFLERAPDPARQLLLAIARWEGWGGPAQGVSAVMGLGELVRAGRHSTATPVEKRAREVALRWVRLAALLGDADARDLLRSAGEAPGEPEELDGRDLLAFDGSSLVHRSNNPGTLLVRGALEAEGELRWRRLRDGALGGVFRAQWQLALLLEQDERADPRRWLFWAAMAGLQSGQDRGFPPARVAVGRALIVGRGCAPEPDQGVRWLESLQGLEEDELFGLDAVASRLWLGLARRTGQVPPADPEGGLKTMREALERAGSRAPRLAAELRAMARAGDAAAAQALEALGPAGAPPRAQGQ